MGEVPGYGPRPRMRGWLHVWAALGFALALPYTLGGGLHRTAFLGTAIFQVGLVVLFTISALYHRVDWTPRALARMRKLDHAFIYVLIAGVFTPFCLMALPAAEGGWLLAAAWGGAGLGVGRVLLWPYAPKPVAVTTYAMLPLLAAPYLDRIYGAAGPAGTACMVVGQAIVAAGAVVYAYNRPDPVPGVFGPHEIFHATVVACAVLYTIAVVGIARAY